MGERQKMEGRRWAAGGRHCCFFGRRGEDPVGTFVLPELPYPLS